MKGILLNPILIVSIITLGFIPNGRCQNEDFFLRDNWELKGPVKSSYQTSYGFEKKNKKYIKTESPQDVGIANNHLTFNSEGQLIQWKSFNVDELYARNFLYNYNKSGKLISINYTNIGRNQNNKDTLIYNHLGLLMEKSNVLDTLLIFIEQYEYDSLGILYGYKKYYADEIQREEEYSYDSLERINEKFVLHFNKSSEKYTYDTIGNIIHVEYFNVQNKTQRIEYFEYNEAGYITSYINDLLIENKGFGMTMNIKSRAHYKTNYYYHKDGKISLLVHSDKEGKVEEKIKYTYNDEGYLINEIKYLNISEGKEMVVTESINYTYDSQGNILSKLMTYSPDNSNNYIFEYDAHNNWVKQTKLVNEVPLYVLEREIEYYK